MKYNRSTRRMFLQGAGKTLLALPFLPSLFAQEASGASGKKLKYIQIFDNYGCDVASRMPAVNAMQAFGDQYKKQSIASVIQAQGKVSQLYNTWWNAHAADLNLISNYHAYTYSDHHTCSTATTGSGTQNGNTTALPVFPYSVDYVVSKAIYKDAPTAFDAIRFMLNNKQGHAGPSFCGLNATGQPRLLGYDRSVSQLYSRLTTKFSPELLNSVQEDYKRLMNNRRLSSVDRTRLSDSADLWSEISKRQSSIGSCAQITTQATPSDFEVHHKQAIDLIVAALACGLTQVAAYALYELGADLTDGGSMHAGHHNGSPTFRAGMEWRSKMVAHFVARLAAVSDTDGSRLLDNSVLYWGQEYAGFGHKISNYSCLLAGKAGGALETGVHLDAGGRPIGNVLVTIMKALGLSTSEIEVSGSPGFGDYYVPNGLAATRNPLIDSAAKKRAALPILK